MRTGKVTIVGALTSIGRTILALMAEHDFPRDQIIALDEDRHVGVKIPYGDGMLTVNKMSILETQPVKIALVCRPSIIENYKENLLHLGTVFIDCCGSMKDGPCIVAPLNMNDFDKSKLSLITNPSSLTVSLAQVLEPIHKRYQVRLAEALALLSAGEFGVDAIHALQDQARSIYTKEHPQIGPFQKIQAFNLLPAPCSALERQSMAQIKNILDFPVSLASCLTPIFQGESYSLVVSTRKSCSLEHLKDVFTSETWCKVVEDNGPAGAVTTIDTQMSDFIYLTRITSVPYRRNTFHMWVVCDSVKTGAALNAVRLVKHILS